MGNVETKHDKTVASRIAMECQCPFFVKTKDLGIMCEGLIAGTTVVQKFSSVRERNRALECLCCVDGGKDCLYYKALMQYKYEEEQV